MKVFLSWSKEYSKKMAAAFEEWLPFVLQDLDVFMSTQDVDLGRSWSNEINDGLKESSVGLIFVTSENVKSTWINFEAGALSKSLITNAEPRVIPILCGEADENLISETPLMQFQSLVNVDRDGMFKLIGFLNKYDGNRISSDILKETFDTWWPKLEKKIKDIDNEFQTKSNDSSNKEIGSEEIVDALNSISSKVNRLTGIQTRDIGRLHSRLHKLYDYVCNNSDDDFDFDYVAKEIRMMLDYIHRNIRNNRRIM